MFICDGSKRASVDSGRGHGPTKRAKSDFGYSFTSFDKEVWCYYKTFSLIRADVEAGVLFRTIIKIIKWDQNNLFELLKKKSLSPKAITKKIVKNLTSQKTPFFTKSILSRYTTMYPVVKKWLSGFACLHAVRKVLKHARDRDDAGQTAFALFYLHPETLKKETCIAGVLDEEFYFLNLRDCLGAGKFGSVHRLATASNSSLVVKRAKDDSIEALQLEWKILNDIHYDHPIVGIQKRPYYLVEIEGEASDGAMMVMPEYDGSLSQVLARNPRLFTSSLEVFKAFKPIFEALCYCSYEKNITHNDVGLRNILVQNSMGHTSLDLADWGIARKFGDKAPKDVDHSHLKEYVRQRLQRIYALSTGNTGKTFELEGTSDQLYELLREVMRSRDVFRLGEALKSVLEITIYSDRTSSEWLLLRGYSCRFEDPIICKVDDLLSGMTDNEYVPNEIAGIALDFPKRISLGEAVDLLNEIISLMESE